MLLLLLNHVVLRALWKIDVHLISTFVNKSIYYYIKENAILMLFFIVLRSLNLEVVLMIYMF